MPIYPIRHGQSEFNLALKKGGPDPMICDAPIMIIPDHRELIIHSCDVGTPASVLSDKFPELSFDELDEVWWHQGPENENGVPVVPIDVFQKRIDGFEMANCEVKMFEGGRASKPLGFV